MTTPVDIDKLKELLAKATRGPWRFDGDWHRIPTFLGPDGAYLAFAAKTGFPEHGSHTEEQVANAHLIVAAVNGATALIAKAERVDALEVVSDDAVSTLAAIRATTISSEEWEASRLHFRDLCGETIARMNAARNALSPTTTEAEKLKPDIVKVTQADREAAARTDGLGGDIYLIRDGALDDHPLVQAFARYRISVLEEAAKVLDEAAQGRRWQQSDANAHNDKKAARDFESMAMESILNAAAIRSLSKTGEGVELGESDIALAERLRALLVEVAGYWGFTIPAGPLDGMNAAALEAMVRAAKEDRSSPASNKGGRDGE